MKYWYEGQKNIIGCKAKQLRKNAKLTQAALAGKLQLAGYDFDRLTIGRIESGDRFVADYEIKALAEVFNIAIDGLYQD